MYVEVLLAMALMSFVLLATAPMFIMAAQENAAAGDETYAMTATHDKVEELKREPYDALISGQDEVIFNSIGYDRVWVVSDDDPHPGMRTITVTVTPRRASNNFGGNRIAEMRVYRAN